MKDNNLKELKIEITDSNIIIRNSKETNINTANKIWTSNKIPILISNIDLNIYLWETYYLPLKNKIILQNLFSNNYINTLTLTLNIKMRNNKVSLHVYLIIFLYKLISISLNKKILIKFILKEEIVLRNKLQSFAFIKFIETIKAHIIELTINYQYLEGIYGSLAYFFYDKNFYLEKLNLFFNSNDTKNPNNINSLNSINKSSLSLLSHICGKVDKIIIEGSEISFRQNLFKFILYLKPNYIGLKKYRFKEDMINYFFSLFSTKMQERIDNLVIEIDLNDYSDYYEYCSYINNNNFSLGNIEKIMFIFNCDIHTQYIYINSKTKIIEKEFHLKILEIMHNDKDPNNCSVKKNSSEYDSVDLFSKGLHQTNNIKALFKEYNEIDDNNHHIKIFLGSFYQYDNKIFNNYPQKEFENIIEFYRTQRQTNSDSDSNSFDMTSKCKVILNNVGLTIKNSNLFDYLNTIHKYFDIHYKNIYIYYTLNSFIEFIEKNKLEGNYFKADFLEIYATINDYFKSLDGIIMMRKFFGVNAKIKLIISIDQKSTAENAIIQLIKLSKESEELSKISFEISDLRTLLKLNIINDNIIASITCESEMYLLRISKYCNLCINYMKLNDKDSISKMLMIANDNEISKNIIINTLEIYISDFYSSLLLKNILKTILLNKKNIKINCFRVELGLRNKFKKFKYFNGISTLKKLVPINPNYFDYYYAKFLDLDP